MLTNIISRKIGIIILKMHQKIVDTHYWLLLTVALHVFIFLPAIYKAKTKCILFLDTWSFMKKLSNYYKFSRIFEGGGGDFIQDWPETDYDFPSIITIILLNLKSWIKSHTEC